MTNGKFIATINDGSKPKRSFDFTGTKSGSALTITFAGETPAESENIAVIARAFVTTLKIIQYGKNDETSKWRTCTATYSGCE